MWFDVFSGFTFLRPVWLLALIPAWGLCWFLYQRMHRRSGWEALLPVRMSHWLLQRNEHGAGLYRYALLGCCWSLAALALAGPAWEADMDTARIEQSAIVVALDVSHNMLAEDISPNRLERAKRKVRDILALPDDYHIALVAYAGSAHRVTPLSTDHTTLANLLGALEPGIMPNPGRDVAQALTLASHMISQLPKRSAQILLMTSGAEGADLEALEEHARLLGPQLNILGIGTASGSPVALAEGEFMRDAEGRILLARLDSQALAGVARRNGSGYHGLTLDDSDLHHLLQNNRTSISVAAERQLSFQDKGHWLVLLLLPLAALGARRGWLGLLCCIALLPAPAEAAWEDLWQRPDQQAAELLRQDKPAEAAALFEDPAWRGWAWYQSGNHEAASEAYAKLISQDPDNPDHHFNYGTSLAMIGRYDESLEAFEQALTRAPNHQGARHNRRRVEEWLEEQKKNQQAESAEPAASAENDATAPDNQPETQTQADGEDQPMQESEEQNADTGPANGSNSPPSAASGDTAMDSQTEQQGAMDQEPERDGIALDELTPNEQREQQLSMQQWLEDIPDDPAELLRRKFLYQHLRQQDGAQE